MVLSKGPLIPNESCPVVSIKFNKSTVDFGRKNFFALKDIVKESTLKSAGLVLDMATNKVVWPHYQQQQSRDR